MRGIVENADPKMGETDYDPAAGTVGFLTAACGHVRAQDLHERGMAETANFIIWIDLAEER